MSAFPRRGFPLAAFVVLCLLLGVAVLSTQVHIENVGLRGLVDTYLFDATQSGFALLAIWRGIAVRAERSAWLVIGTSMLVWCGGNILSSFLLAADAPTPSSADAAWLGAYPGFYLGLWLLFRARTSRIARASLLDGAVVGLAVGAVCAAVVVEAVWSTLGGASRLETATNLAYPIADLIVLSLVVAAMVAAGRRPSISWALLAGGMATFAVSDAIYLWRTAHDLNTSGLSATFWLFGLAMMAASAGMPAKPMPARRSGVGALAVLLVGALLSLGLLAAGSKAAIGALATVLAVTALAIVLVRLVVTYVDNSALLRQLDDDANTDALTGISNRRRLLDDLQQAVDGAVFRASALVIFDLDGFKTFNDRMGHLDGDALLTRLGQRLDAAVSGVGSAYRMGGDEFCALIPAEGDAATQIAARYARLLCEDHPDVPITCSAGAALIPADATDVRTALLVADGRMYADKAARRLGRRDGDLPLPGLVLTVAEPPRHPAE